MDVDNFVKHHEHEEDEELNKVLSPSTSADDEVEENRQNTYYSNRDYNSYNNIPLGYRFCPTDSQAFTYLINKVYLINPLKLFLLANIVDFNIYQCQPSHLPGMYHVT